jgi:hypothetical protein
MVGLDLRTHLRAGASQPLDSTGSDAHAKTGASQMYSVIEVLPAVACECHAGSDRDVR